VRNEHITPDQMFCYVNDALKEVERMQVEQHLTACDTCLQLFIAIMESTENEAFLPPLDMELMEDRVVAQLVSEQVLQSEQAEQPIKTSAKKPHRLYQWLQHPATHYTIAASITLLLLASGTFASFSQKLAQLDVNLNVNVNVNVKPAEPPKQPESTTERSESWSDKMVDQTGSWLDGLRETRYK
jgi:anti-sigma factor RsiW